MELAKRNATKANQEDTGALLLEQQYKVGAISTAQKSVVPACVTAALSLTEREQDRPCCHCASWRQ
jgi:hypothetical protein